MKKCFEFAKEKSSSPGVVYRPIVKVGLINADGDLFELSEIIKLEYNLAFLI